MDLITIGGRKFKGPKDTTVEHDVFLQAQIAKAKLDRIEMLLGETPDEYALRIFRRAANNTDVFLLLGGLLVPAELKPTDWSEQVAEETGRFFRKLTDEKDKRIIQGQIIGAIMGFFQKGLAYSVISPRSSKRVSVQPAGNVRSAGPSPMENGPQSSVQ